MTISIPLTKDTIHIVPPGSILFAHRITFAEGVMRNSNEHTPYRYLRIDDDDSELIYVHNLENDKTGSLFIDRFTFTLTLTSRTPL
jgi:hypothetical protein